MLLGLDVIKATTPRTAGIIGDLTHRSQDMEFENKDREKPR